MSMRISPEGVAITERFFKAIELLINAGHFRGLQTFTSLYGINRRNLMHIKGSPTNTVLKPETLVLLVRYHNVSPMWLLTGEGAVFQDGKNIPPSNKRKNKPRKQSHNVALQNLKISSPV